MQHTESALTMDTLKLLTVGGGGTHWGHWNVTIHRKLLKDVDIPYLVVLKVPRLPPLHPHSHRFLPSFCHFVNFEVYPVDCLQCLIMAWAFGLRSARNLDQLTNFDQLRYFVQLRNFDQLRRFAQLGGFDHLMNFSQLGTSISYRTSIC